MELKTAFTELVDIVHELRDKCPWDKKQTWESLRTLTVEELYELLQAIDDGDKPEIKKELGDILLHVLFYSRIAEQEGSFTTLDVITDLKQKLIDRHPHIYGDAEAKDDKEVLQNWETTKLKKGHKSLLAGVPDALPALPKALRLQMKVAAVGFDWKDSEDILDKINEELREFKEAQNEQDKEQELGDLLFTIVNYCRHHNLDPERALESTNRKFRSRFEKLEALAKIEGVSLNDSTSDQLESWWAEAKRLEKQLS